MTSDPNYCPGCADGDRLRAAKPRGLDNASGLPRSPGTRRRPVSDSLLGDARAEIRRLERQLHAEKKVAAQNLDAYRDAVAAIRRAGIVAYSQAMFDLIDDMLYGPIGGPNVDWQEKIHELYRAALDGTRRGEQ